MPFKLVEEDYQTGNFESGQQPTSFAHKNVSFLMNKDMFVCFFSANQLTLPKLSLPYVSF